MKIIAKVNSSTFMVEMTSEEIGIITGKGDGYSELRKIEESTSINDVLDIHARYSNINSAANLPSVVEDIKKAIDSAQRTISKAKAAIDQTNFVAIKK